MSRLGSVLFHSHSLSCSQPAISLQWSTTTIWMQTRSKSLERVLQALHICTNRG
ncbi:hypothetical protein GBAR_LOCUS9581 [Geodia barretti]|uniref:Uncharacterized protein n=1 Tax=Geodia barretti TaxID=519541 RepID=A0AA35RRX4_GEOBA|nr:hypothetical protein GBAR_LOCUS9581 [Geodia barretti]